MGEKHKYTIASHMPPTGDLVCNPGMCPDQESNWQPFASQSSAQSTKPHQPGLSSPFPWGKELHHAQQSWKAVA